MMKKGLKNKKVIFIILIVLMISIPLILGISWINAYRDLFPASKFTQAYKSKTMKSPTLFLDRNNKQLGSVGGSSDFQIHKVSLGRHHLTTLSKILFAKEDRKIQTFNGIQQTGLLGMIEASAEVISWKGKLRAAYQTIIGSTQGASGLLEQIAGNLYGHDDHNPWFQSGILSRIERKVVKTANAIRLAHLYGSPEQIVEDYVNLTYTAGMYHGINAFMLKRFNRHIDQVLVPIDLGRTYLDDSQIDILNMLAYYVGQLTGPANYDPGTAKNPIEEFRIKKRAEFKKNLVLTQMKDLGLIQQTVYLQTKDRKLPFSPGNIAGVQYDPNIEVLRREAIDRIGSKLGGQVKTTLVKEIHDAANYLLIKQRTLLSIKATRAYVPSKVPILRSARPELYGLYRVKVVRRTKNRVVVSMGSRMGNRTASIPVALRPRYLNYLAKGRYISIGIDGFDDKGLPIISLIQTDPLVKGAFVFKDLSNGNIVTFGGGGYLNAAISPGSAFKPFLLDLAFHYGWRLEDQLNNSCFLTYRFLNSPAYSPKNYGRCDESKKSFVRYPDIRTVLKKSINKPVVYLLDQLSNHLPELEYMNLAEKILGEKGVTDPGKTLFLYSIRSKSIDLFMESDKGGSQFVGRIPIIAQKEALIYEKLKREKYLELIEVNKFDSAAKLLDHDFEAFLRWHTVLVDVKDQFAKLKEGLELYEKNGKSQDYSSVDVAALDHFFYDQENKLSYDPYSPDQITFINWELAKEFLEKRDPSEVFLGNFTLGEHDRYEAWVADYQQTSHDAFYREMIYFHPKIRGLVNIELFKQYLSELTGSDREDIHGDYSLPLGTHRVSLLQLSNMYGQILTESTDDDSLKNNRSYFFDLNQAGMANMDIEQSQAQFSLKTEADLIKALTAARQEKGGTSFHLKSKSIVAGKTGTDPKYKTYVAIVNLKGKHYLVAAYFGVDHNKHEKLVKAWTGGWTAAVFIDRLISQIEKKHLSLLPQKFDYAIEFDPDFEYDATTDLIEEPQKKKEQESSASQKEPTVIWQPDGTYKIVDEAENAKSTENEPATEPSIDMEYSDEEIDKLIQTEEE